MATFTDTSAPVAARPSSFDLLTHAHCLDLLDTTTVGRLAFSGAEGIVLLPVNYHVVDGQIVVRISTTGALGQLLHASGEVVFEVDYHSPTAHTGWSVLVRGRASVLTRELDLPPGELARVVPWAEGAGPYAVLTLPTERLTGRIV